MWQAVVAGILVATTAGVAAQAQNPAPPAGPAAPPAGAQIPPAEQKPPAPVPGPAAAAATTPAAPACPVPVPPAVAPARALTSTTGLLLHQVQPTRVADFERFLLYVRDALAKTTNATVRNQARGWKFYRVAEPGPNGDVLYAFLLDPAVPCVDYALGPIVAEAYPDPAQLGEIWKLYTGSVRSGGSLMNFVALPVAPAPPVLTPAATPQPPASGTTTTTPPSATPGQAPQTQKPSTGAAPSTPNQTPPPQLDARP